MTDKPKRTSSTLRHPRPEPTALRNMASDGTLSWVDRLLILGLVVLMIAAGLAVNYGFWSVFVTWKCGC